jgi:prepilin-type N-terminal cleavage/methylation domain-containing protein
MNTTETSARSPRAFTLIELLIVIAIIGILMSLLFPAVNSAIDAARKAQAKNDVVQIATAITAYETEYGRLPLPTKTTVDNDLVAVLAGLPNNTNNPRGIVFLEVQAAKKGKSGTNTSGFIDPWAISDNVPARPYKISMDSVYSNEITAGTNNATLRKKVGVWSDVGGTRAARRNVSSWE